MREEPDNLEGAVGRGVTGAALPGDLLCLAISHELKNDLQVLEGVLTLIEGDPATSASSRHRAEMGMRVSRAAASRLRTVAGALLEESGAILAGGSEPVREVLARAIETVALRTGRAREDIDLEGAVGAAEIVTPRPFLLELAIANLLHNAVLSTPAGRRMPLVRLQGLAAGGWAVTVEDSGVGMPEEARRVLTGETGALAEVDITRASARWGIGLMLVRAAAVAAGWELRVIGRAPASPGTAVTLSSGPPAARGAGPI